MMVTTDDANDNVHDDDNNDDNDDDNDDNDTAGQAKPRIYMKHRKCKPGASSCTYSWRVRKLFVVGATMVFNYIMGKKDIHGHPGVRV